MPQQSNFGAPVAQLSRRDLLKIGGVAALGAGAIPLIAGCSSGSGSTSSANSITFGSNYSDPAPKAAFAALTQAATKSTGVKISLNTVDHNTFQNNITSYLQGTPNDLFTWFAGYRVQVFANQGLIAPIDDVWDKIGDSFPASAKALSKGTDGHYYIVPIYNYPWVVFYNKSTFQEKGYQIPTTWDAMIALCKQMKSDGLVPFAFGQQDGWPALGTFDIINLRMNGFEYHMQLMQHKVPWTDSKVTDVLNQWAELLPYCQTGATGRIWEDAVKTLEAKQAGMMFQGTNQVAAQYVTDKADLDDLDFFVYPEINPAYGQQFMDAPADGFCLSKKAKNVAPAKKVLEYIGSGPAEAQYLTHDEWDVALATDAKVSSYNAIQTKSVQVIAACSNVAQFFDRDSDPGFADNTAAAAFDKFINNPTASTIKSIQNSLEAQAKTVFTS